MTIDFEWIKPSVSSRRGSANASMSQLVVKKVKGGKSRDGKPGYAASIAVPEEMMRAARFVIGDRVTIGVAFDEKKGNIIGIKRVIENGHRIGAASHPTKGSTALKNGKIERGRIQLMWREELVDGFKSGEKCYEVTPDGVLVAWEAE